MRPLPGGDALSSSVKPRSRKSSVDHAAAASNVPTAFFMKSEEEMEQSLASTPSAQPPAKERDSTFGVESLADTLEAAFGPDGATPAQQAAQREKAVSRSGSHGSSSSSSKLADSLKQSPARKLGRNPSSHASSTPLTPLHVDTPSPAPTSGMLSTPSAVSLQSLKLSDEDSGMDDSASQAIVSSGEEEGAETTTQQGSMGGSFPQLVMPSIQMPSRRPFTTKGKAMGKLKVMVAGETGIGKSSLVRSIVQSCEDIVHVDPLSPSSSRHQSGPPRSKSRRRTSNYAATARITEIHASTKPYPYWWTDVEESRVLRRRKSSLDAVLERNICFVDTPGFTRGVTQKDDMELVIEYVESLLRQTSSVTTMEDNDVLGVVSGSGGVSIDVVIYLLPPNKDISTDIEYMQCLSSLTNVVPVIAKADTLSAQEAIALKTTILARLQTTPIKPFFFGKGLDDALLAVQSLSIIHPQVQTSAPEQYPFTSPTYPYAISSTPGPDNETMDASLLMSPDYVQPLLPSELTAMISQIFNPESIAWLRHSAAKKFLGWRRRARLPTDSFSLQTLKEPRSPTTASVGLTGGAINTSANSSVFSAASPSGVLVPQSASPFFTSNLQSPFPGSTPSLAHSDLENPSNFSLARHNSFGQADQPLSEIRIAKWATDLQRSLRNERDRFEELQRDERAKWLIERVGEEVSRGTIVVSPGGSPRAEWAVVRHGDKKQAKYGQRYTKAGGLDSRDPLGLCNLSDQVKRRGFVLVKVLGGVSVLGAIMVAVIRAFGVESGLPQNGWRNWLTGNVEW
ncbi:Septin-domain-containing protein [Ampelomyces quisqualis]|uniref:Septin-domain-containing protein n=1 Tax=Ampelomyces quisqualis TaxID=50730 RepID=A0A6A5QFW2_AMPQU|nr:Septin-domain-containing protein [Ampelomyces quisqualis]